MAKNHTNNISMTLNSANTQSTKDDLFYSFWFPLKPWQSHMNSEIVRYSMNYHFSKGNMRMISFRKKNSSLILDEQGWS